MNTDLIKISDKVYQIINNLPVKNNQIYKNWKCLNKNDKEFLKMEIERVYNEGFGFKLIAQKLGLSYTQCRRLVIEYLQIKTRTGQSVITDKLKEIRSKIAIEIGRFLNWPKKYPDMQKHNQRGIQGYYWNKSFNKWVWIRSSYEFIYAKWLDSKNIIWDMEVKYFNLNDGRKYLPDFFIYKEDKNTIESVVEIKGHYKYYDRQKQDKFEELPILIIKDINLFLPEGSSKMKELRLWKKTRKLSTE